MINLFGVVSVLLWCFAIAWSGPRNVSGVSFQIVALSRAAGDDMQVNNGSSYGMRTDQYLSPPIMTPAYAVFIMMGSGDGRRLQALALDTAASMSWVMCQPCRPELAQKGHIFSPGASPTFHGVHSNDPVCVPPYHRLHTTNRCSFHLPTAVGRLARETFRLRNKQGAAESFPGLVLGCANGTVGFHNQGILGGVLSLSPAPLSLVTQLGAHAGGRFSYCLPLPRSHELKPRSFLFLGADVPRTPPDANATSIIVQPGVPGYQLRLVGITIGDKRLNIDRHVFLDDHSCTINPAVMMTEIVEPAFIAVETALVPQMKKLGWNREEGGGGPLVFNKIYRSASSEFPKMVFHFQDGGELWFPGEYLFDITGVKAHFLVGRGHRRTVIGAMQQVNKYFMFDVARRRLTFVSRWCS
ncbi:protein ASPARTIC PROTEASE IN GUARD CELL 1-like [Hordeum vulgare]|nr:protein ASPARTIC PROTEASE IN GUARD CELL 1-like [Hordeum vulgare]